MSSERGEGGSPDRPAPEVLGGEDLAGIAAEKLPHEEEHLAALERMAGLEPYYRWVAELAEAMNGGPLGSRVLDAGCGIGNFVEIMRHRASPSGA
mgnify:CR=1 FL=1